MVWPSAIGKALSSYATSSKAESRKKCRGILLMAFKTFSSVIPLAFMPSTSFLRKPLCRYVSSIFFTGLQGTKNEAIANAYTYEHSSRYFIGSMDNLLCFAQRAGIGQGQA